MKLIILGIVLFFLYRYFNGNLLPAGRREAPADRPEDPPEGSEASEGEYIDYEEVD